MKLRADVISAIFGIYFVTIASGSILVASGTSGAWYDAGVSSLAYGIYLITYVALLLAISLMAIALRRGKGPHPSLAMLAGPAIVAAVYAGVASILLPGIGGNYRLNTAAILTLAYSWIGLALYLAAAIGHILQEERAEAEQSSSTDKREEKV